MARATKAQLAAGKIVALPTAAPQQVNNHRFADQRRASLAARKASRFIGRYHHHQQREADPLAKELTLIR